MMIKGDIFCARPEHARHPYVFIRKYDEDSFIGVMLTHSGHGAYADKNILMKETHFKNMDNSGGKYEVVYDYSCCVVAKLIKRVDWESRKVGELTAEGMKFVESVIDLESPQLWEEYSKP